jgi:hypothetical protein
MHKRPLIKHRLSTALVGGALALGLAAAPASASICPPGWAGDPNYCVTPAPGAHFFRDFTRTLNPSAYFRMDDGVGADTMAGDNGLPDGEYKNGQDSGPIGIADDADTARTFFGEDGYGYVNNLDAPNYHGSFPYGNYTMEAWVYLPSQAAGTILEFGRAGSLYIDDNFHVIFRNGDDETTPSTTTLQPNTWYMVAAVMRQPHMTLYVQASPVSPVQFAPGGPDATGTSNYRPEGSPTFYVGFGHNGFAPWFNGSIDEVVYVPHALTYSDLATQFYDDPVPDASTMTAPAPAATPSDTSFSDSSSAAPTKTPPKVVTPLAAAKAKVKSLTASLARMNGQLKQLIKHHASKTKIATAKRAVKAVQKQLAAAKARVKALTPKKHPAKKPAKKH